MPKAKSESEKPKVVKLKKDPVQTAPAEEMSKDEPKKRKSRAKPQPTREELLKMLSVSSNDIKTIIHDLKEDEQKLLSIPLKQIPELLKETLNNLDEDMKEIDEQYKELLSLSEAKSE